MRSLIAVATLGALLITGCETTPKASTTPEPTYEQALNNTFTTVNYGAVSELMKRYQGPVTTGNSAAYVSTPLIVTTLVNIDQLEQSSTLGRLISEQITSRMAQMGHEVVELKVRNSVFIKRNEGEFLLTREIKEIASAHNAQAVVVGTYAESATLIYVSLKLVNPANSKILAAYDYALPLDRQIRSMLRKNSY